jgi:hypothetical protein
MVVFMAYAPVASVVRVSALPGVCTAALRSAAVLLVLAALPGVATLDFGRIGAGERHFDRALDAVPAVSVRPHRDDAAAGILATALAPGRRRVAVLERQAVVLRRIVSDPDDDVDRRVDRIGRQHVRHRAVGVELPARVVLAPRPFVGERVEIGVAAGLDFRAVHQVRRLQQAERSARNRAQRAIRRAVDEGRCLRAADDVVPVGHGQDVLHHPLDRGVGGVHRLGAVAVVVGDLPFRHRVQDERRAERHHQDHRHQGDDQGHALFVTDAIAERAVVGLHCPSVPGSCSAG